MRLYLSSQRLGTAPENLVALLQGKTRIAVIANAADHTEPATRESRVERELADLSGIGLDPEEVDLRRFFDRPDRLSTLLERFDALWVLGGNAIVLRTAFGASGADVVVTDRLAKDSLVYAGYSAGGCILGPRAALAVDSFGGPLPGYPEDHVDTGMGLVPFAIAPHYGREPGAAGATGVADHYIDQHIPFVALRDGQAIVVDGDVVRVVE
jgi:dipeptidase E